MKNFAVIAIAVALACSSFALAQETRKPEEAGPSLWDRTYEQSWETFTTQLGGADIFAAPSSQIGHPAASSVAPDLTGSAKQATPAPKTGRLGPAETFSGGAGVMAPSPMMQGEIAGHPQVPPMSDGQ